MPSRARSCSSKTAVAPSLWPLHEGLPLDVPLGHRTSVGESVAGRVLATGQPLLLGDVDQDAFVNFVPKARPISSSLVVPIRIQGATGTAS